MNNHLITNFSFHNKVVFISGGLGGIGRTTIEMLLKQGANIAFTYAEGQESIKQAQELVDIAPNQLSMHGLDLRYINSIRHSLTSAHEKWGRLDILINNAAVGSSTVEQYSDGMDGFSQDSIMFSINADGVLKMCQVFLEKIKNQINTTNLKMINISSVGGGIQAFPGFRLSDGMSKAGVAFMTKQLASEMVHTDIDVFAICPGATRTKMFEASTLNKMTESERKKFIHILPKRRLIEPYEIANIIIFLASEYSTPLHGAVIDASMGLGVRPGLQTENQM